jgi:hypothetical protein
LVRGLPEQPVSVPQVLEAHPAAMQTGRQSTITQRTHIRLQPRVPYANDWSTSNRSNVIRDTATAIRAASRAPGRPGNATATGYNIPGKPIVRRYRRPAKSSNCSANVRHDSQCSGRRIGAIVRTIETGRPLTDDRSTGAGNGCALWPTQSRCPGTPRRPAETAPRSAPRCRHRQPAKPSSPPDAETPPRPASPPAQQSMINNQGHPPSPGSRFLNQSRTS